MTSSRRRAILHLGFNKTGTSSLQDFVALNRERLRERGICYPEAGSDGVAHHPLAEALRADDREGLRRIRDELSVEATAGEDLLFSSEALASVARLDALRDLLADFDVTIIAYVREHNSHLVSWYQQDIQMSDMSCSFRQYAWQNRRVFGWQLESWRKAFGRERMQVRLYDRRVLADGDIVADFMALIGVGDRGGWQRKPYENNPSVTGNLLFFKKLCNCFGGPELRAITSEIQQLSKLSPRFRGNLHVPDALVADIVRQNSSDREMLRATYGIEIPERKGALDGQPMPDAATLREDWDLVFGAAREGDMAFARLLAPFRIVGG